MCVIPVRTPILTCINEDVGGTKLNYTICFGLAGEVVSGILVYREAMCTEYVVKYLCDWVMPFT